jgi:DNA-binding LacI/PurR family transcriptional regulator
LRRSPLPTVLLQDAVSDPDWPRVLDDEAQGIALLVDAIVAQGHRRAAIIVGRHRHDTARRIARFRSQMASRGVVLPEENIVRTSEREIGQGLQELLALPERPTVAFTWNDRLGYKLLEACDRAGVSVPEALSLVGYDGIHWPSTSRHILTSVAVDMQTLTREAVELLDHLIERQAASPVERMVPVTLFPGTTLGIAP